MTESYDIIYYAPMGPALPDPLFLTEKDYKPWDPESTEDDALWYHRSDMRRMESLLLTYQYCSCDKTPEVIAAIKTIRDSLSNSQKELNKK